MQGFSYTGVVGESLHWEITNEVGAKVDFYDADGNSITPEAKTIDDKDVLVMKMPTETVYVLVYGATEDGDITVKVEAPIKVPMVVNAEYKWATFCAPFDVDIPEGVTAYTVDGVLDPAKRTLDLTEVNTTIPANIPVVLYSEKDVNETFIDIANYDGDPHAGLLFGVYEENMNFSDYPDDDIYLLSNVGSKVAFYPVDKGNNGPTTAEGGDAPSYNMQYKAYLSLTLHGSEGPQARGFFFSTEDAEATAIEAVEVLTDGDHDAIYNAAGIQVDALQKGLNIVVKDGKSYKIYVK
jgi:hypothetical protein